MSTLAVNTSRENMDWLYRDCTDTSVVSNVNKNSEVKIQEDSKTSVSSPITYNAANGQTFTVTNAENFSVDHPLLKVSGTDENGDEFQEIIDPRTVDPENASYIEYSAFASWLTDYGDHGTFPKNLIKCQTYNIYDKADYLGAARNWRDDRISIGDMVGFRKAVYECSVITTYLRYKSGDIKRDQVDNPNQKIYIVDNGLKEDYISNCYTIGNGAAEKTYSARYAEKSTAENPIVEVFELTEDSLPVNIHSIALNNIDPRNATQMEMYALCTHAENIRNNGKYPEDMNTGYYAGVMNVIFDADNWNDFIETKKDWTKALTEITNSDQNSYRKASATELMDFIRKYLVKFQESTVDANSEVTSEMVDQLFEDRDQKI